MESLIGLFTGFLGHIIAHDFCEAAPMLSKKLIEAAASRLPSSIRERYLNEWLADLHDQASTVGKIKWALSCLLCARRMQTEEAFDHARRTSFRISLPDGREIDVDVPTFSLVGSLAAAGSVYKKLPQLITRIVTPVGYAMVLATAVSSVFRWRRCGVPDFKKSAALLGDLAHFQSCQVTTYYDGVQRGEPVKVGGAGSN
jgi:hypothetical protein